MSVLVPANGFPRLIRFRGPFDDPCLLATLDRENNILHINKELYATLDTMTQHCVDKTAESFLYAGNLSTSKVA